MNKIKVCFVITKGVWGGAGKYVYQLATNLPKDRYDVLVITGNGQILPDKLKESGVKVEIVSDLKRDISIIAEIKSSWRLLHPPQMRRHSIDPTTPPWPSLAWRGRRRPSRLRNRDEQRQG